MLTKPFEKWIPLNCDRNIPVIFFVFSWYIIVKEKKISQRISWQRAILKRASPGQKYRHVFPNLDWIWICRVNIYRIQCLGFFFPFLPIFLLANGISFYGSWFFRHVNSVPFFVFFVLETKNKKRYTLRAVLWGKTRNFVPVCLCLFFFIWVSFHLAFRLHLA